MPNCLPASVSNHLRTLRLDISHANHSYWYKIRTNPSPAFAINAQCTVDYQNQPILLKLFRTICPLKPRTACWQEEKLWFILFRSKME